MAEILLNIAVSNVKHNNNNLNTQSNQHQTKLNRNQRPAKLCHLSFIAAMSIYKW